MRLMSGSAPRCSSVGSPSAGAGAAATALSAAEWGALARPARLAAFQELAGRPSLHHTLRIKKKFVGISATNVGYCNCTFVIRNGLHHLRPADSSGALSFRELNRKLRRDVKTEAKEKKKAVEETVEIADMRDLRKKVKSNLLQFSNVDVAREEFDPLTGMMIMKTSAPPVEMMGHGRPGRRGGIIG